MKRTLPLGKVCQLIEPGPVVLFKKYDLFVLEVVKSWTNPSLKNLKTIHHHGYGRFVVDGERIMLKSKMR